MKRRWSTRADAEVQRCRGAEMQVLMCNVQMHRGAVDNVVQSRCRAGAEALRRC